MTKTTISTGPDLGVLFDAAMTTPRPGGLKRTFAQAWSLAVHHFMRDADGRALRVTYYADGHLATDEDGGGGEVAYLDLVYPVATNACLSGFGKADRSEVAIFMSAGQQMVIVPRLAVLDLELLG